MTDSAERVAPFAEGVQPSDRDCPPNKIELWPICCSGEHRGWHQAEDVGLMRASTRNLLPIMPRLEV